MLKFFKTPTILLNRKLQQLANIIREHDGESIGIIDDVYEARFCENKNGYVQAVLYDEEDRPICGIQYSTIAPNCMKFLFGYVKKPNRGHRFAEKLSNALLEYHEANASEETVYTCMGGYADAQTLYVAKKFFSTGKFRVWICESFEDVGDDTEIHSIDDFDNVFGHQKIMSYVTVK